jgi:SPX domain protein involved in polyphosphate accumulation
LQPHLEDIKGDWRFEYKYRLTYHQYYRVRSAILPFMKKDRFSLARPQGNYYVRSLYFDSDRFTNYEEKMNGNDDRLKLRIRTYQSMLKPDDGLRVELKARKGLTMEKHSTWIKYFEYMEYMASRHWSSIGNPILEEFERYSFLKELTPKILVDYEREGYSARGMESLRITFDHKVRSTRSSSLFPVHSFFRVHYPGQVVLEIKCDKTQPAWVRNMVQQQGLGLVNNSKFAQGIELVMPEMVRSTWSD